MKHNAMAIHVRTQVSALAIMTVMFSMGGEAGTNKHIGGC
jgi:hypothetical protein